MIPPAWTDVRVSARPRAKLQAIGVDSAGRRQYLYHPEYRAQQERAKFDKLVQFAERLPAMRAAMTEDMRRAALEREWVSSLALRLIDAGWFRPGGEKHLERTRTFGITTLLKRHARVRGSRVHLEFVGKNRTWIRSAIVDLELAQAINELKAVPGGPRLFRYRGSDALHNLTSARLNDYIHDQLGDDFSAKDFRTWGGTLCAAIGFAERGPTETEAEQKRVIAAVMRQVGERLGNTPAVARASYVSPAVVGQYLEGRTITDFRPRRLRVVATHEAGLNPEESALETLLRDWQSRRASAAA